MGQVRSSSRWLRWAAAGTGALALLLWAAAPAAAASGSASAVPDGITHVAVSPVRASVDSPLTVTMSFCVPSGSAAGSSVTITVPAALTPMTTGFLLANSQQQIVAIGTVSGQVVTLTTAPFVQDETSVCGQVAFPAAIDARQVSVNAPNTLQFRAGGTTYGVGLTPVETLGAKPDEPITYGIWTHPADQGRTARTGALTWYLESAQAAQPSGDASVDFADTPAAGQSIVCTSPRIELGTLDQYNHFVFVQSYTGTMTTQCSPSRVTVRMGALAPGTVARLVLQSTPSPSAPEGGFGNFGSVAADGSAPVTVMANRVVHYAASGAVAAVVTPVSAVAHASSANTAPTRAARGSATPTATARAESAGPSSSAVALLVGLVAVAAAMIGTALRARRPSAD